MSRVTARGPSVHQAKATASWTISHRWGSQLSDVTDYTVRRVDDGGLTLTDGKSSFEIRAEILDDIVAAINAAAVWSHTA